MAASRNRSPVLGRPLRRVVQDLDAHDQPTAEDRQRGLERGIRFRYHGADGRVASGLWSRGLLKYQSVSHEAKDGGLLVITPAGRAAITPDPQADVDALGDTAAQGRDR